MKNKKAGMTLIEIIVAVIIIAIAGITSFQFLVYCDKLVMQANSKIVAANFAREIAETLYQKDYDALVSGSGYPAGIPALGVRLYKGVGSYDIGTEQVDALTNTQYKVITVTVTWNQ
ncbi:MAG: prepilin-type N-terminal cleavage/methylation domain-containing protein [Candidatus Omnitrophica bacterium]|nr:prepilin-type N-terminal cleavage/methylation domain-containing protein [Candidatus Omnitrophota bacterium]